jgi:hypothetical protein
VEIFRTVRRQCPGRMHASATYVARTGFSASGGGPVAIGPPMLGRTEQIVRIETRSRPVVVFFIRGCVRPWMPRGDENAYKKL